MGELKEGKFQFDILLNDVTHNSSLDPDWAAIIEICDLIMEKRCEVRYALAEIIKKTQHEDKSVATVANHVLNSVVGNCEAVFQQEQLEDPKFIDYLQNLSESISTEAAALLKQDFKRKNRKPSTKKSTNVEELEDEESYQLQLAYALSTSDIDADAKQKDLLVLDEPSVSGKELKDKEFDQLQLAYALSASESEISADAKPGSSRPPVVSPASAPPKKVLLFTSSKECVVCRKSRSMFYACAHMSMCFLCATRNWKTEDQASCPVCKFNFAGSSTKVAVNGD